MEKITVPSKHLSLSLFLFNRIAGEEVSSTIFVSFFLQGKGVLTSLTHILFILVSVWENFLTWWQFSFCPEIEYNAMDYQAIHSMLFLAQLHLLINILGSIRKL